MLYHTGDSQYSQNIHINKVIGENASFMDKEKQTDFLANPIHSEYLKIFIYMGKWHELTIHENKKINDKIFHNQYF